MDFQIRHMLQPTHHPEIWEFQCLHPHEVSINVGKDFSGCADVSSTASASAQMRGGSKCGGCRETANCSRACQSANCVSKASHLVQQNLPETLVSEIVRPSPEAAELFNVSASLAAAAIRVRVDP